MAHAPRSLPPPPSSLLLALCGLAAMAAGKAAFAHQALPVALAAGALLRCEPDPAGIGLFDWLTHADALSGPFGQALPAPPEPIELSPGFSSAALLRRIEAALTTSPPRGPPLT